MNYDELSSRINSKGDIEGTIDLNGSDITCLPETLTHISGELILRNCKLEKLPDNFRVWKLEIGNCPLKELPAKLSVEELIIHESSKITSLPSDIHIGLEIKAPLSLIQTLPENLNTYTKAKVIRERKYVRNYR